MADGDKILYTGALLYCNKGSFIMPFVASFKKTLLYGPFIGTTVDNKPVENIPPLGACACKHGSPCAPAALVWEKYHDGALKIEGAHPLLVTSECKCSFGGTIKVFDTRFSLAAAIVAMPKGKDKERLLKACSDLLRRDEEERAKAIMAEEAEKMKWTLVPQRKSDLDMLKDIWRGTKGLVKLVAVAVIYDVAEISGNDGDAAVKSVGESIGVDLDGTNKAVTNAIYAFDDMTVGEKAKFIGNATLSFFDCESPGEMICGTGGLTKIGKGLKTAEDIKKAKKIAKEAKVIEVKTTQAAVEKQKTVKGVMKVKIYKIESLLKGGTIDYNDVLNFAKNKNVTKLKFKTNADFPDGFKYKWSDGTYNYQMHGHGSNPTYVGTSNNAANPTVRIIRTNILTGAKDYLAQNGIWGPFSGNKNACHIPLKNSPY